MSEPESTDDIIRKMRSGEFREIYGGSLKMWDRVADRLKAALEREVGNAAKMREALERLKPLCQSVWESGGGEDVSAEIAEMMDIIKAALAAPARNCDVGTAEEQIERHREWCRRDTDYSNCCNDCRDCFARWAQMPYEKEVNK